MKGDGSGAPGKQRRAGVAWISKGFGSEAVRNDGKKKSPRRHG